MYLTLINVATTPAVKRAIEEIQGAIIFLVEHVIQEVLEPHLHRIGIIIISTREMVLSEAL